MPKGMSKIVKWIIAVFSLSAISEILNFYYPGIANFYWIKFKKCYSEAGKLFIFIIVFIIKLFVIYFPFFVGAIIFQVYNKDKEIRRKIWTVVFFLGILHLFYYYPGLFLHKKFSFTIPFPHISFEIFLYEVIMGALFGIFFGGILKKKRLLSLLLIGCGFIFWKVFLSGENTILRYDLFTNQVGEKYGHFFSIGRVRALFPNFLRTTFIGFEMGVFLSGVCWLLGRKAISGTIRRVSFSKRDKIK